MESTFTLLRAAKPQKIWGQVLPSWAISPQAKARRVNGYAAASGITGSLLTALNFFAISTCSYLRPIPGV
jgi:hypothetical protein